MKRRTAARFLSIFACLSLPMGTLAAYIHLATAQVAGGPEGNGNGGDGTLINTHTPTATPTPTPTQTPTGGGICEAYIFTYFHGNQHANIFTDTVVEQIRHPNGNLMTTYKPNCTDANGNQIFSDPYLRTQCSDTKGIYQPKPAVPPSLSTKLNNFFYSNMEQVYLLDLYVDGRSADDERMLWRFWTFICQQDPNYFVPYEGSRNYCNGPGGGGSCGDCGNQPFTQARYREFITVNGYSGGNVFSESYYFDNGGNLILKPAAGVQICDAGAFYTMQTPLSLVMEEGHDLDSAATMVKFPVMSHKEGQWFLWKASAKAPLLVYDPEHSGKITSAQQLFGNYTFGGKRLASLANGAQDGGLWRDGFEALASLDTNGDGEVSGIELEPLGLWFDENQNGVSETGEVRTLASSGVTRLFYNVTRTNAVKDLVLDRGFERVENGKPVIGKSVDWLTTSAPSEHSLAATVLNHPTRDLELDALLDQVSSEKLLEPESGIPADSTSALAKTLSGGWTWHMTGSGTDPAPSTPDGFITFEPKGESVSGVVYAVQGIPAEIMPPARAIMTVSGFDLKQIDGSRGSFTTYVSGGGIIRNEFTISSDGNTLQGQSVGLTKLQGKPIKLRYSWAAKRVKPSSKAEAKMEPVKKQ